MDFIVAVLSIPWAANGLGSVSEPYDYDWGALPVRVVAGVAFGLALVFGYVYLGYGPVQRSDVYVVHNKSLVLTV